MNNYFNILGDQVWGNVTIWAANQVNNIKGIVIDYWNWLYVSQMDQNVASTANVEFGQINMNGNDIIGVDELKVDTIIENTLNNGVDLELVHFEDGDISNITSLTDGTLTIGGGDITAVDEITVNTILESTLGAGVNIENANITDNTLQVDNIDEITLNNGVDIDGVLCKDNEVFADNIIYKYESLLADPTNNDDSSGGFQVGTIWLNIDLSKQWICIDNSVGAAIWKLFLVSATTNYFDHIAELTAGHDIVMDNNVQIPNILKVDHIQENSANHGTVIEGVEFKDNNIVSASTSDVGNKLILNTSSQSDYVATTSTIAKIIGRSTTVADLYKEKHNSILSLFNDNAYDYANNVASISLGTQSHDYGGGKKLMTFARVVGGPDGDVYAGKFGVELIEPGGGTMDNCGFITLYNVCWGLSAGVNLTNNTKHNVMIGDYAGTAPATSGTDENICIGYYANATDSADGQIAIGSNTLSNSAYGVAIGYYAKSYEYAVSIGYKAGNAQGAGDSYNTYCGYNCGSGHTDSYVSCYGYNCGSDLTSGSRSSFYGYNVGGGGGSSITGTYNFGFGHRVFEKLTSGTGNCGYGGFYDASLKSPLSALTTGDHNICLGASGYNITTGSHNITGGLQAGKNITTSDYSVCLGYDSGPSSNYNNTINIGYAANTSSTYGIAIGTSANVAHADGMVLGISDATTGTGQIRLGCDTSYTSLFSTLRNTTQVYPVTYNSTTKELIYTSCSAKYKNNIRKIEDTDTSFIYDLEVKKYEYASDNVTQIGVIAEELYNVKPEFVLYEPDKDDPNKQQIGGWRQLWMIEVLLVEVQKHQAKIIELESKYDKLEKLFNDYIASHGV